ncbi:MAG: acyl-CoA dehydrogenase family protein [Ilumatobacteraceae bacterium]
MGGRERTALERFIAVEELLADGAPVMYHWVADRQSGPMILRFGSDQLQSEFLPSIAAGARSFAIGMSEPDAGSDLAAVTTVARPVDGGWLVSGTKVWTSGANEVEWILVLCRTAPSASGKHDGLSQLVVPLGAPGVTVTPIETIDGSSDFCEVAFDEVYVPSTQVLGNLGEGWAQVNSELSFERAGPDRYMSSCLPLLDFAGRLDGTCETRAVATVGDLAARWWAIRQLGLSVARSIDRGAAPAVEAAIVKDLGTTFEQEVVERVRTMTTVELDPNDRDPAMRRLARATLLAPSYTIRGGTSEVLRVVAARGFGAGPAFGNPTSSDDLLTSTVAKILERHSEPGSRPSSVSLDADLWARLADAGIPAIGIDEAAGGSGGSFLDAVLLVPLFGRYAAQVPYVETVLANWVGAQAGLGPATGPASIAIGGDQLRAEANGDLLVIDGSVTRVPWASAADELAVVVPVGDRCCCARVDVSRATVERGENLAGEPRDTVSFDALTVGRGEWSELPPPVSIDVVERWLALLRCLQVAGACQAVTDLTLRYAGDRVQFGKPIRTFQAVQRHLVALAAEASLASISSEVAARIASSVDSDAEFVVGSAKIVSCRAARDVAAAAHQVHGAIGMTSEYPLGRLTRRLWSWTSEAGGEASWSRRLGLLLVGRERLDAWTLLTTDLAI